MHCNRHCFTLIARPAGIKTRTNLYKQLGSENCRSAHFSVLFMKIFSSCSYRSCSNTGICVGTKHARARHYDSRTPGAADLPAGALRGYLDRMPNGRSSWRNWP
jgi:hypothetical protein